MIDPSREVLVLPYRETVRGSVLLIAIVFSRRLAGAAGGVARRWARASHQLNVSLSRC